MSSQEASGRATSSPALGMSGSTSATLGWVNPPAGLQLTQVHYMIRHGERTPVRERLQKANPAIPVRWNMCHASRDFRVQVLDIGKGNQIQAKNWKGETIQGTPSEMQVQRRVESTDDKGKALIVRPGDCFLGELTDLGRASSHLIGTRLRNLYIEKLGLLPDRLGSSDEESVYFRSTNMGRTIQSLEGVVRGLLPQTQEPSSDYNPTLLVRNGTAENLLPNTFGCSKLRRLDEGFSKLAASIHNPELALLDDKLSSHMEGALPRVDGHPRLSGILDTIRASKAHGIPIPAIFEDGSIMEKVERAVVDEWYIGYRADDASLRQQYRRLAMGRFLNDLSSRLNEKAKNSSTPLKMAIYSAHDTSLAGLLSTLDVFDNHWPAFTASFGLELFKEQEKKGLLSWLGIGSNQHYVRMRYGDNTLKLPACSKAGDHLDGQPEFCTLQAFNRAIESLQHPTGKTWLQECEEQKPKSSLKS